MKRVRELLDVDPARPAVCSDRADAAQDLEAAKPGANEVLWATIASFLK